MVQMCLLYAWSVFGGIVWTCGVCVCVCVCVCVFVCARGRACCVGLRTTVCKLSYNLGIMRRSIVSPNFQIIYPSYYIQIVSIFQQDP